MPFFPKLELLFIHIPKTGGGSIEAALSTMDAGFAKHVRHYNRPHWRIARFLSRKAAVCSKDSDYLYGAILPSTTLQHLTLQDIESLGLLIGQPVQKCVAAVRNPYSRMVSLYHSHFRRQKYGSFDAFVHQWLRLGDIHSHDDFAHRRPQIDYIRDAKGDFGRVDLIRFEDLAAGFTEWVSRHYSVDLELPHRHSSGRKKAWMDYYTSDTTIKMVQDYYAEDFSCFEYPADIARITGSRAT